MSLPIGLIKWTLLTVVFAVLCFRVYTFVYKKVKKLKGTKLDFEEL